VQARAGGQRGVHVLRVDRRLLLPPRLYAVAGVGVRHPVPHVGVDEENVPRLRGVVLDVHDFGLDVVLDGHYSDSFACCWRMASTIFL
jgi:hypothetical protein